MGLEIVTPQTEARDITNDIHNHDFNALAKEVSDINKFGQNNGYAAKDVYAALPADAKQQIGLQTDKAGNQFLEITPLKFEK
jgi:hypothetical protein